MEYRQKLAIATALVRQRDAAWRPESFGGEGTLDDFLQFAHRQQIIPTLYGALGPDRLPRDFPARFAARLQAQYDGQCLRHAMLLDALRQVDTLLRSAGIDFVVLKGPVHAAALYGGLDNRQWSDLDILVRRADLPRALAALETGGFALAARRRLPQSIATRFDHAMQLRRGDVLLDLHWAIRNRPAYRLSERAIWSDLRRQSLAGLDVRTLSPEHSLLAAILEFAQDAERNGAKAKNLLDLYLLIRTLGEGADWAGFLERRSPERLRTLTVNVLAVVLLALDCGEEFPSLRRLVLAGDDIPVIRDSSLACRLLDPDEGGAINRWWFGRIYPGNRLLYWVWLAAALLASPDFPRNVPAFGRAWRRMTAALGYRAPDRRAKG